MGVAALALGGGVRRVDAEIPAWPPGLVSASAPSLTAGAASSLSLNGYGALRVVIDTPGGSDVDVTQPQPVIPYLSSSWSVSQAACGTAAAVALADFDRRGQAAGVRHVFRRDDLHRAELGGDDLDRLRHPQRRRAVEPNARLHRPGLLHRRQLGQPRRQPASVRRAMATRFVLRRMKRACAGAAALALALAAAPAQAYFVPRHQAAWPGLANSSSYTSVCDRLQFPTNAVAETTYVSFLGHTTCVSPNYAVSNVRVMMADFLVWGDGRASPEACPGNSVKVDFLTFFIGGTAYPVSFGGAIGINVDNCKFVWSDPLVDSSGAIVTIPANTTYYVRPSKTVASGGYQATAGAIGNLNPNASNNYAGLTTTASGRTRRRRLRCAHRGRCPAATARAVSTRRRR